MHVLMSGPTATNVFKLYSAPFSTQILERQVHEFEFSELSQKHWLEVSWWLRGLLTLLVWDELSEFSKKTDIDKSIHKHILPTCRLFSLIPQVLEDSIDTPPPFHSHPPSIDPRTLLLKKNPNYPLMRYFLSNSFIAQNYLK